MNAGAWKQRWGTMAAAAVLLVAVWEIAVLAHAKSAAPKDADWSAAAAAVKAERAPGDLIVFAPRWIDPVGRLWFGDLMTMDDVARMDAARYARVWEVSIRGARAPEATGEKGFDRSFGAVRVRRFDRAAPPAVTWSFAAGAEVSEVAHEPHRCVHVPPPAKRDTPAAQLGTTLVVYAGIADVWNRKDNKAYADLRVLVDGAVVSEAVIGNDSGWLALPVATTTPGPHTVTFETAVDRQKGDQKLGHLDLCVAAEARR